MLVGPERTGLLQAAEPLLDELELRLDLFEAKERVGKVRSELCALRLNSAFVGL